MNNENCARLCQTEIALVPSSPLADLYNIITYIDQEKIDEDALRIINIPQSAKRRSILPVSKFGLTDHSRSEEKYLKTSNEETTVKKKKTEEMSSQTDLMVSPHILIEEERAVVSMSSSCQTFISCTPSISLINIDQQPETKKKLDQDDDEQNELYKNAAEILSEIVHDVITIPQRILKPAILQPDYGSQTSCPRENPEWKTVSSEGNEILHSQVNNDDGMLNLIVDNSCKGDVLYCRSDDNVSVDSTISEKSSMPSLDYAVNTIEEDLSVIENVEHEAIVDIEENQSSVRLTSIEENNN